MKSDLYAFAEFLCPLCDHQFVTLVSGSTYALKGSDEVYTINSCPACGTELFVCKRFKYGVIKEFISEEDVKLLRLGGL